MSKFSPYGRNLSVKKEVSHRAKAHQHEQAVLTKTWLKKHAFSNMELPTPSNWRESRCKDDSHCFLGTGFICRSTRPPSVAPQLTERKKNPMLSWQKSRAQRAVMTHHEKPRSRFVWVGSSDSISFFLCDCGLTVEGCASHGFDPTGDGGFLTWHNTWLTELLLWRKGAVV